MDSVVEKLSDIESTAEAIVEHAETQKFEIEQKIQAKRDKFDHDIEDKTQEKLHRIRAEAEKKINALVNGQREKNQTTINALKKEYEEHHTDYAKEILKHMTEV